MELFERGSIADQLAKQGPLPPSLVTRIGTEIASALSAAHRAAVVHGDVKPANILVGSYQHVLADFGIARTAAETDTSAIGFTPEHAAPELVRGQLPSYGTDVWALASTLYALLTGHGPFSVPGEDNVAAYLRRVDNGTITALSRSDVPPGLHQAIIRCLDADAGQRIGSADAARRGAPGPRERRFGGRTDLHRAAPGASALELAMGAARRGRPLRCRARRHRLPPLPRHKPPIGQARPWHPGHQRARRPSTPRRLSHPHTRPRPPQPRPQARSAAPRCAPRATTTAMSRRSLSASRSRRVRPNGPDG